jgi:DNA (cytosine-5)-methyltransferase 3A
MVVVSLFDGISGTQQALKNMGVTPDAYYASEVDKYAISITQKNFPDTIQLGDVTKLHDFDFGEVDLMTWGSPCQDLSIACNNRTGLKGQRSGLFWDALKIWKRVKPKYWIMENVASMSKEAMHTISRELGVYPIMIDSQLVTAQQRKRYYWTNIKGNMLDGSIEQPKDRYIYLKDILEVLECEKLKSYAIRSSGSGSGLGDKHNWDSYKVFDKPDRIGELKTGAQGDRVYSTNGKSISLSAVGGGQGAKTGLYACALRTYPRIPDGTKRTKRIEIKEDNKSNSLTGVQTDSLIMQDYVIRKLTPIECERLQGYPDDYTKGISNTQRYKALGNSFTVPVVEYILSFKKEGAN